MPAHEATWFYVSLDTPRRTPTAVRLVGAVQAPGGAGLLVEPINNELFNCHRLLLVPSGGQAVLNSAAPEDFVPIRAFSGNHLEPGQAVAAAALQPAMVLDIAGITRSRQVAENWSRK